MRAALRIVSVAIIAATVLWWFNAGKNTGWTKNRVAIEKVDEFTGITFTEYEERFVPGIEILAAGTLVGTVLGGLTFLRRRPRGGLQG